jgi:hypothetical protein
MFKKILTSNVTVFVKYASNICKIFEDQLGVIVFLLFSSSYFECLLIRKQSMTYLPQKDTDARFKQGDMSHRGNNILYTDIN